MRKETGEVTWMIPAHPAEVCSIFPPQTIACLVHTTGSHGTGQCKGQEVGWPALAGGPSQRTSARARGSQPFPFPGPWPSWRRESRLKEQRLVSEAKIVQEIPQLDASWRELVRLPMDSGVLRRQRSFGGVGGLNNTQRAAQSPLERSNFNLCR